MKILYIITKSNWGGAQRHVFDLATSMKAEGHDVAVALGGNGTLRTNLESAGIYTHNISQLDRDMSATNDTGSFREILSVIRHRKPDVLHLHSPKAAGLGALAGRILRVPHIIHTVHGWAFNESRPLHQRITIIFFSWLTVLLSHTTILLSQREYNQTLYFPFAKHHLKLIPPGIRPPVFMSIDGAKQFISKLIGLDLIEYNKKTTIVTIAELHPNKGLKYLLEALETVMASNPHSICVIIGDGQDKAALNMLIRQHKLDGRVFLTGYLDRASEYLKAFNVFVLSSIKEGLPYVILEAGVASIPVVATTVGGIPEVIEDMRSGVLVQPRNVRELAHAISFMIEHPEERRKYGVALREKVVSECNIEKMIDKTKEIYKKEI